MRNRPKCFQGSAVTETGLFDSINGISYNEEVRCINEKSIKVIPTEVTKRFQILTFINYLQYLFSWTSHTIFQYFKKSIENIGMPQ